MLHPPPFRDPQREAQLDGRKVVVRQVSAQVLHNVGGAVVFRVPRHRVFFAPQLNGDVERGMRVCGAQHFGGGGFEVGVG